MSQPVNPMQIIQMIKSGHNPQQLMLNFLEGNLGSTPMGANLLNLAKGNRTQEIEQFARNYCKQRGVDFDSEFTAFKKNLGL